MRYEERRERKPIPPTPGIKHLYDEIDASFRLVESFERLRHQFAALKPMIERLNQDEEREFVRDLYWKYRRRLVKRLGRKEERASIQGLI